MAVIDLLAPPLIDRMIADSAFHAFSFLKDPPTELVRQAQPRARGCGFCGKPKRWTPPTQPYRIPDYNEIKLRIALLAFDQQEDIKSRLGVDGLIIQYRDRKGVLQKAAI